MAFFFAAGFFLPPFLVAADFPFASEDRLDSFLVALENLPSECWTGFIPLLGMFYLLEEYAG
ncbi:MAG TPA: hypothetical protein VFX97_13705 [Pyrinomonadaceae bacterium]|nr:hypothetical protein [Pyrinomonadaceae bacterium]